MGGKYICIILSLFCLVACHSRRGAQDPAALLEKAWTNYRLGEWNSAVEAFSTIRQQAPAGSEMQRKATYGLATTWNLRRPSEDPELARKLFTEILSTAPKSEEGAWSALALARMEHLVPIGQEPNYPAVRKAYQKVIDAYPNHRVADEAFIYQQSTLVASLDERETSQALTALRGFVRTHPDSPLIHAAYGLIAGCCQVLKDYQGRLDAELKQLEATTLASPFDEHSWTYWRIACIAEFEVGDFETAKRFYKKLADEYPNDQRVYAAHQAIKRMEAIEEKFRKESGG